MIAYRLLHPQEPPQLQEVPKPSPSAGQQKAFDALLDAAS